MPLRTDRMIGVVVALVLPGLGCGGELATDAVQADDGGVDSSIHTDASAPEAAVADHWADGTLNDASAADGPMHDASAPDASMSDATGDVGLDVAADGASLDGGPNLHDACSGVTSGLVTLAPAIQNTGYLAITVTSDTVLWANYVGIWKSSLDGCNTQSFPNRSADSMVVLGSTLYWADEILGNLNSAPLSGGPVTTVVNPIMTDVPQWPFLTSDGVNLYWTVNANADAGGAIWQWQPGNDGGTARPLATGQQEPTGIANDSANLYWVDYGYYASYTGTVMAMPLDGGSVRTLATGANVPFAVATDGVNVYWGNGDGTVMKVGVDGASAPVLLAKGPPDVLGIATDGAFVYWTGTGGSPSHQGAIMKVPVGGGAATTLMASQNAPRQIAVDSTSVYWAEAAGGVYKLTPK